MTLYVVLNDVHSFWQNGYISMAILPLPLIQEKQLSVTGERNVH